MNIESLKNGLAWTLSLLLGLSFLAAGWPKLMPNEAMVRRFENWGYNSEFAILIGGLELAAGLLALLPKTAFYGAGLVLVLMIGAVYTHLSSGIGSSLFALIYLLMAAALLALRFQSRYKPGRG